MLAELLKHTRLVLPIEQTLYRSATTTHCHVKYLPVNVDDPGDYIEVASCGDGADTQDKGSGKAMTYAYKYMWLRTFSLPTGEDPDKISSEELDDIEKRRKESEEKPGFRVPPESDPPVRCVSCGLRLQDYFDGKTLIKAADLAERSNRLNGRVLCPKCTKKERSNAG